MTKRLAILVPKDCPNPKLAKVTGKKTNWVRIAKLLGLDIEHRSAHHAVLEHDKSLHDSINHFCPYAN